MVDTRRRNRNPYNDDNRYGDVPTGAVGFRREGRDYPGGYGSDADEFYGGVVDDGHGGPRDDEGFAPAYSRYHSGLGALGDRDPNDPDLRGGRDMGRDMGRDVGRDMSGPHRGRGPKGYRRSDERIHEDVCERLMEDRFIDASNVEVTVKDGEVTLSGTVASRGLKYRAEDLAELASGVRHVQNNLRAQSIAS
ncbi:BON domain-containing protein [Microvirga sp. M2]|uniref:BON domain-containing protein n=1 Tax=Microvirga sp. M2 TaxID=3073270 RepID=UPI0039C1BF79